MGILASTLVFGLILVGCDNGSTPNGGGGNGNNNGNGGDYSVPSAPSSVTATPLSSSSIKISWSSVSNATAFDIYYEVGLSTTKQLLTSVTANGQYGTSYTHTGLLPNTTYYYYISSYNNAGSSTTYGWDYATTSSSSSGNTGSVPNAPSTVYATSTSPSSITVSWSSVSNAAGYYIYRRVGASGSYSYRDSSTSTSYADTGLSSNTTYYYRISAYNSNGESSMSTDYDYATTSSGTIAGSSYSNAITIPPNTGISGSFPSGLDAVWYKFTGNGSGMLGASDSEYSSTYTSDIVVDVYDSDLYLISAQVRVNGSSTGNKALSGIDMGNNTTIYAVNWSGTYYVKVLPYDGLNSNKGTFVLFWVD
jgi:hypothetical protein